MVSGRVWNGLLKFVTVFLLQFQVLVRSSAKELCQGVGVGSMKPGNFESYVKQSSGATLLLRAVIHQFISVSLKCHKS